MMYMHKFALNLPYCNLDALQIKVFHPFSIWPRVFKKQRLHTENMTRGLILPIFVVENFVFAFTKDFGGSCTECIV